VTWKDLHIHYGGESTSWLRCAGACVGTASFVVASYALLAVVPTSPVGFDTLIALKTALIAVSVLSGVSYLYGAVSRAASCCRREKLNNSLELLLTTDISGYSIIMGKSNAISLTQLPWIIAFLIGSVAFIAVSILAGNAPVKTVVIVTAIVFNLFCMVFAFEYVAIYFSLKMKNFSTATALAAFVAWYVVGNLLFALVAALLAPFTIMISVLVIPVAGPIMVGNHFRLKLIQEFHTIAIGRS
jgi:ABC-type Na+ efflux pump permease subunit